MREFTIFTNSRPTAAVCTGQSVPFACNITHRFCFCVLQNLTFNKRTALVNLCKAELVAKVVNSVSRYSFGPSVRLIDHAWHADSERLQELLFRIHRIPDDHDDDDVGVPSPHEQVSAFFFWFRFLVWYLTRT